MPQSVQLISETHSMLRRESDLSPKNPRVNRALSQLVETLSDAHRKGVGDWLAHHPALHDARQDLPRLCGIAEGHMESYWTEKFLNDPALSLSSLSEFWYYRHYQSLWQSEETLCAPWLRGHVVMLGSGPLPMTAIFAAVTQPALQVTCVDYDERACAMSRQLISRFGLEHRVTIQNCLATHYAYLPDDFVLCGSLVSDKRSLYETFSALGVSAFAVRDADGVYCYIYEPSPRPNPAHYHEVRSSRADHLHINTTRLYIRPQI